MHNNLATQCIYIYIRGPVHEFMHGWGLASLARGRGHGQLASLPAGRIPCGGGNLNISLVLYRIYTEWPDYYVFRDHNNLATQCKYYLLSTFYMLICIMSFATAQGGESIIPLLCR